MTFILSMQLRARTFGRGKTCLDKLKLDTALSNRINIVSKTFYERSLVKASNCQFCEYLRIRFPISYSKAIGFCCLLRNVNMLALSGSMNLIHKSSPSGISKCYK